MSTKAKMWREVKIPCETNFREILLHFLFNVTTIKFYKCNERDAVFDNFSFMERPDINPGMSNRCCIFGD